VDTSSTEHSRVPNIRKLFAGYPQRGPSTTEAATHSQVAPQYEVN
jgi:hypothetical protein